MAPAINTGSSNDERGVDLPLYDNPSWRTGDDNRDIPTQDDSAAAECTDAATSHYKLEDRVEELERKLATLALLLSHQRIRNPVSPTCSSPRASPPRDADASRYLALESPISHPERESGHRRNLSFRVLHGPDFRGDEDKELSQLAERIFMPVRMPELTESDSRISDTVSPVRLGKDGNHVGSKGMVSPANMALSHGTALEAENGQTSLPQKSKLEISPRASPVDKPDNVKSKWLDYLNSFQESNYDTDKQMEEFVKIPSAVEALLSFGFWICVDSFLYILTILPIRSVWSSLLLARFLAIRCFHREVPDGPFRFHRRYAFIRKWGCCVRFNRIFLTFFHF
jgi:hypothetical protein